MIPQTVYLLCGLTSILCAFLLCKSFLSSRDPLLFWSTLCFICLALTNVLLFLDLITFPSVDMSALRSGVTLAGMVMLLYGMIQRRS